jgi:S1-C subfamily serine protease
LVALCFGCGGTARGNLALETTTPEQGVDSQHAQPVVAADVTSSAAQDVALVAVEQPALALEPAPTPAASAPPALEGYAGVIDRADLIPIIDAGLGRLFQRVRVEPALKGKRFVGFQIASIDPALASAVLVPGDVIVRVNGQAIERPEQALTAFERLRVADELVLDLLHQGEPSTLRFRIE